jgi:hypothetical protein
MMMGCGIYTHQITQIKNWDVLVKGFLIGTNTEPFDVFMRGWMRQAGWSETNLIGDRWNTQNYRDGLICDPGPTEFKSRDHSKTDVSGACVIHGCKDGSLARLVLEQGVVNIAPPVTMAPAPQPTAAPLRNFSTVAAGVPQPPPLCPPNAPPAPQGNPEFERQVMDALLSISTSLRLFGQGLAALTAMVKEATQPDAEPETPEEPEQTPPPLEMVESSPAEESPPPQPKTKADIETLRGIVNGSTVAQRIGRLAKDLKMNEDKLRKMILKPDSRLIIRKGYVRLAVAAA